MWLSIRLSRLATAVSIFLVSTSAVADCQEIDNINDTAGHARESSVEPSTLFTDQGDPDIVSSPSPTVFSVPTTYADFPSIVPTRHETATNQPSAETKYNLLVITADQLRFDALGFVQDSMKIYDKKLKVRTPNIDRLASQGVHFSDAYSQSSSCAPARATLRSGCTVERHGIQANGVIKNSVEKSKEDEKATARKIEAIRTYDQILHHVGYQVESYGKFHVAERWFYDFEGTSNAISYDSYSINFQRPYFSGDLLSNRRYISQLQAWSNTTDTNLKYEGGQQMNPRSMRPYTPLSLDPRYGFPTNSPNGPGLDQSSIMGVDSVPSNQSLSAFTGIQAVLAIQRLSESDQPWAITVSFEHPHPPYVAPKEYASYYLANQHRIVVPSSMKNPIQNDYYASMQTKMWEAGYNDRVKVQQWTALYYAMVEQLDDWVGTILDELDALGVSDNTLVVFTADHGEFLGAHGLNGKFGFFEEALRVPLIMRLPNTITEGTVVSKPVSHLDVFSTLLDYVGHARWDASDGKSLRQEIAGMSYRQYSDDEYVVAEVDFETGDRSVGRYPNFMIRHGSWKLMIPKLASSKTEDLMFNLDRDPFEKFNLLQRGEIGLAAIGKAEHLKCLLVEWLSRNDGELGYYSSRRYNGFEGKGDIEEVRNRRTWATVDQWLSDSRLEFGQPVYNQGMWRSNAWLYIGRTNPGTLKIYDVAVAGKGRQYFKVIRSKARITHNEHLKIKIAFESDNAVDTTEIEARLVIKSNARTDVVSIVPWR